MQACSKGLEIDLISLEHQVAGQTEYVKCPSRVGNK